MKLYAETKIFNQTSNEQNLNLIPTTATNTFSYLTNPTTNSNVIDNSFIQSCLIFSRVSSPLLGSFESIILVSNLMNLFIYLFN